MHEYARIDTDFLLTVGVLATFALLAVSLLRMLSSVRLSRSVSINRPWAIEPRSSGPRLSGVRPPITRIGEPADIDLARLDDDGGGAKRPPDQAARSDDARPLSEVPVPPATAGGVTAPMRDDRFKTPLIPGAREPGVLTTFGVPAVVFVTSPTTMDAATTAAREREGGGAPSERRLPHERSSWNRLTRTMRRILGG